MFKKIVPNMSLCVIGFAAGLLLCEILLRVFYPQGKQSVETAFFIQYDPELGWVNKPQSDGLFRSPFPEAKPFQVKINRNGFRGIEHTVKKPEGSKRLIAIGDSVTFGYGVNGSEVFTSHLAERLYGSYEVLNGGVVGYGSDQELILLEREALKYSPDIVLVGFSTGNDLFDTMSAVRFRYPKPFFILRGDELVQENTPVPQWPRVSEAIEGKGLRRFLVNHSHLYRFLAYRFWLKSYFEKGESEAAMSVDEGWRVTEGIIKKMKYLCDKAGSRLFFVIIPDGHLLVALEEMRTMRADSGIRGRIIETLERNGIPYIDLWTPFLEEQGRGKSLHIDGDPDHWNSEGHRLAASLILARMKDLGVVSKTN